MTEDIAPRLLRLHTDVVAGELKYGRLPESLALELASAETALERVLKDDPSWEAVFATAVHMRQFHSLSERIMERFTFEAKGQLENLVWLSGLNPPSMEQDFSRSPKQLEHRPEWSIYFHSIGHSAPLAACG